MSSFTNKIDFAVIFTVNKANPNGDPLNGNMPREDYDGFGEMSDVCVKRKLRNRLQDMGERIFVQSSERCDDGFKSLSERAKETLKDYAKDAGEFSKKACETWIDVRGFGQVFAFKNLFSSGVTLGVRGPVLVRTATSASPIDINSMQITKSVNGEPSKAGERASDTMGTKHRVEFGLYVIKGSINRQLADLTGFSDDDAEKIKEALCTLFENDASAARPDGSMEVRRVYWWRHNCPMGQYSSARVHRSLVITPVKDTPKRFEDYDISLEPLDGLTPEILEGR